MATKVLITGGSGMLGAYVLERLRQDGCEVLAPPRAELDIADHAGLGAYIDAAKPDAVLHLAAETNVDLCERDQAHAAHLNAKATEAVAQACKRNGSWLLYISTSNVFGAEGKLLYNELDVPGAVNYYGLSKLAGERAIERYHPRHSLIVRAGWMIGGGQRDHKFVGKVYRQMQEGVELVRAVADRYGTITRAAGLAAYIETALAQRLCGTYHYTSEGSVSRFDIARQLAVLTGFKGRVEPVMSAEFPLSAPRPLFESIATVYPHAVDQALMPKRWAEDLELYTRELN